MKYRTKFVWSKNKDKLYVFYNYTKIGMVPTGIDFQYRGKHYSTIMLMNTLISLQHYTGSKRYQPDDWYNLDTGQFNKRDFVKLCNDTKK